MPILHLVSSLGNLRVAEFSASAECFIKKIETKASAVCILL